MDSFTVNNALIVQKKRYRCSNCAWELDEELFCGQCLIYYDDGEDRSNTRHNDEEITDTESHHEQDEDLEDFVVEDDHVDFENLDQDRILDDSSEIDSDIEISTIHINDDDSEEDEGEFNPSPLHTVY